MQHAVMLYIPTLWSVRANGDRFFRVPQIFREPAAQMNTRGSATVPLSSSWGRTTPHTPFHRTLNARAELLVLNGDSPALQQFQPSVGPARTEGHSSG
jgi:hypothetical protein